VSRLRRAAESVAGRSGALLALAAFALAALILGLRVGTPVLSYDDIYRTLFAHDWARRPYFFTERLVWLPVPLMATGLAIRLTGEAFWTALGVDLAASGIAIWYVHRLTERLFGRLSAWVAASLFGLTPWVLFLSLSRYGEPVLLAATAVGVFHWLRWTETGKGREFALASLALSAAVLSRYEAWPLGVALPVHAALARLRRRDAPAGHRPGPGWAALSSGLPLIGMGIWVWKNLAVYGEPVYGGAFGFLPAGVPAGAWGGARLAAQYLWQLNPMLSLLGLVGVALHCRRAPMLCWVIGLTAIVPWYTVSLFPIDVALQIRLMLAPLMILAPFAGAVIARTIRRDLVPVALAALMVAAQLALDLRLQYPSTPLPMTVLALGLARSGTLDRFDALYVQSPRPTGYPDEARVATNFRRPIHVLPLDPPSAPWTGTSAEAILILTDGQVPPGSDAFVVSRVQQMTAWGICSRPAGQDDLVEWLDVRAPRSMRAGARASVAVRLRNTGSRAWRSNACGVSLAHRWLREGNQSVTDGARSPLPGRVEPGKTLALAMTVVAPASEGSYTLELDLLGDRSTSFGARGGSPRIAIRVTGE
jgi:hypothetical protein